MNNKLVHIGVFILAAVGGYHLAKKYLAKGNTIAPSKIAIGDAQSLPINQVAARTADAVTTPPGYGAIG